MRYPNEQDPWGLPEESLAYLRFFHALPTDPEIPVDIYVNQKMVAEGLRYQDFTHYLPARPGYYTIQVFETGTTGTPLVSVALPLQAEEVVTAAVVGTPENIGIQALSDFPKETEENRAALRFSNLSQTPVSIYLDNRPVVYDLAFGELTDFLSFAPGRHTLVVKDAATNRTLITHPSLQLKKEDFYTAFVIGKTNGRPGPEVVVALEGISYLD